MQFEILSCYGGSSGAFICIIQKKKPFYRIMHIIKPNVKILKDPFLLNRK